MTIPTITLRETLLIKQSIGNNANDKKLYSAIVRKAGAQRQEHFT